MARVQASRALTLQTEESLRFAQAQGTDSICSLCTASETLRKEAVSPLRCSLARYLPLVAKLSKYAITLLHLSPVALKVAGAVTSGARWHIC